MGELGVGAVAAAAAALGAASGFAARRRHSYDPAQPELPQGVEEMLAVLRAAAVVLDVADGVVKASPAAHAYGLVRGSELTHRALTDLARQVRSDGVIREQELELARGPLGPGRLVVHARVAPLGPLHVILLVEDRTHARRLEAVRRDFVVNVSHELKTPVGAISLLSEAIAEAAEDPEAVRRFASRLDIESDRLTRLVKEIIDLSRLQVNQGLEQPAVVAIDSVVTEAVDRAKMAAASKEIALHLGPPSGAEVYGERDLLVTAVSNLVDNAVRYSDAKTRVGIGVREQDGLVHIAIADQGIGIAAGDQDRVFERFFRVDPARSRTTGGTGLGLSIVKHVAANHGGDVSVWSKLGQGSTFTLRLPVARHEDPGAAGAGAGAPHRPNSPGPST